jgi:hypothetical protein
MIGELARFAIGTEGSSLREMAQSYKSPGDLGVALIPHSGRSGASKIRKSFVNGHQENTIDLFWYTSVI